MQDTIILEVKLNSWGRRVESKNNMQFVWKIIKVKEWRLKENFYFGLICIEKVLEIGSYDTCTMCGELEYFYF